MNPQGLVNGGKNPFPPVSEEATRKLIEQLCIDIKFARDIKDCKPSAGGNNNIIKFSCLPLSAKDNHQRIYCVLRTCKTTYFNTNPPSDTDIKSQVAFTQEFREKHGLPIPYTEAWDSTYQNCIGCPYVIMERAAGKTLEYELFKLSLDLQSPRDANMERRCNYARCVAAFLASIDKIKLAGYGTLKAGPEMAVRGTTVNASFELSRDTIDGHRIPWQPDFSKWIENLLRVQFLRTTGNDFDDVSADEKWRIQKLCQVGGEMKQAGLLTDQPAVLWHWDFFPRNIMVKNMGNDAKITAVIDWDEARAVPRIMSRRPPAWLWSQAESPLTTDEKNMIANVFDTEIDKLRPGWFADAYNTDRAMVRALCMYALLGVNFEFYHEMSFMELVRQWDNFKKGN